MGGGWKIRAQDWPGFEVSVGELGVENWSSEEGFRGYRNIDGK